jgi:uracil-DNA glycosylase
VIFTPVHDSWQPIVRAAYASMDSDYRHFLETDKKWLPGIDKCFNAFSLPMQKTRYILFGESPYPRAVSANGFAFWDATINTLFSPTGFSTPVNRATSMRNFLKMLLVTEGLLSPQKMSQPDIAALDKTTLIQTADELFHKLLGQGFLLLNANLSLSTRYKVSVENHYWQPFIQVILESLKAQSLELILMGNIAKRITLLSESKHFTQHIFMHPYNLPFIADKAVQSFFGPFHLLQKNATVSP